MYDQLQEFLNECINWNNESFIHYFFSADSKFMEIVKWKENKQVLANGYIEDDEIYTGHNEVWYDNESSYHLMIMSIMTAKEKIQYFLDNALLSDTDANNGTNK